MLFINNKYTRIYFKIIDNAQPNRTLSYHEKHHIIPRSLGGNNKKSNIAILSAREHFVCHKLLVHMTTGKNKARMFHALSLMTAKHPRGSRDYIITSRTFETARKGVSDAMKQYWTPEKRAQRSIDRLGVKNHFYGKHHSAESKSKISASNTGKTRTDDVRLKISNATSGENNHFYGKKHTDETKAKMSAARTGKPGANRGRSYTKVTCPYCQLTGGGGNMQRFHFNNCKNK